MTDKGTMQDHLDDLWIERRRLLTLNTRWRAVAINAFNTSGGHIKDCDPSDCCCGYQQFQQLMEEEKENKH